MATKSGRTAIRSAAGLVPLALALLLQRAVLPEKGGDETPLNSADAAVCADDIEGVQGCHDIYPTGCSPTGKYDPYLNLLKNQLPQPTVPAIRTLTQADYADLDANLPKDLKKSNHADFKDDLAKIGEGKIHAVIANGHDNTFACRLSPRAARVKVNAVANPIRVALIKVPLIGEVAIRGARCVGRSQSKKRVLRGTG